MKPFSPAPTVMQFAALTVFAELVHGITTRHGGVSGGRYKSFNLSFEVGDCYECVQRNFLRLSRMLQFDLTSLVAGQQVHHNAIAPIDASFLQRNCYLPDQMVPATDGLATDVPGITLLARFADCVPLLFFNPPAHVVGIAHAGWKGTIARISQTMMYSLREWFHCRPETTLVAIGPSIGRCCYTISTGMADEAERQLNSDECCIINTGKGRLVFDLWKANQVQLQEVGVRKQNIYRANICTACTTDHFYSYRKEAQKTGRFGAVIGLKGKLSG